MMLVNTPRKIKFSNPHRSFWEGGHISGFNNVVGQLAKRVNHYKSAIDFANMIFPDKSHSILAKRNIDGLRR